MTAWNSDFSYDYYRKLMEALQENFILQPISRVEFVLPHVKSPVCFLRHDIDVSIGSAHKIASIEYDMGICSTYYVRLNSQFYSLIEDNHSDTRLRMLKEMQKWGHEIGLHYDKAKDGDDVLSCCSKLESLIHTSVRTISFHKPVPEQLQLGVRYQGLINAYAPVLCGWYLSDSSYQWRDGEPLPQLKKPKENVLQLLTHPVWWGEKQMPVQERVLILQKLRDGW